MPVELSMLNRQIINQTQALTAFPSSLHPERVLQFGEGNFLRGFIDWMIFKMNQAGYFNGRIVAIQPTPRGKVVPKLNSQDGLYTLVQRGYDHGKTIETVEVIDSIRRGINPYSDWKDVVKSAESPEIEFVFSNTTEAGLQYLEEEFAPNQSPLSFPGKLVSLLYHRYQFFRGDVSKGWIILPCELIERNGQVLKEICKQIAEDWDLSNSFWDWVEQSTVFCNTLVDRIVTGYPHDEEQQFETRLGYKDQLLTVAEPYHLFVIEGPDFIEEKLPFKKAGLNVYFDDITAYRELKVKFLNAPHTMLAAVGILGGIETVKEGVEDPLVRTFLQNALQFEIKETLHKHLKSKSQRYTEEVFNRFLNPFLHHRLLDISLNSFSKFHARILPSMLAYKQFKGIYPKRLTFSFAALLSFYKVAAEEGERTFGQGSNGHYEIKDSKENLARFLLFWSQYDENRERVIELLKETIFIEFLPGSTLDEADELAGEVAAHLAMIEQKGLRTALELLEAHNEKGM